MGKHLTKLSHLDFDRAPGRLTMLSLTASEALESRIFSGEPPRNLGGITKFPKTAIIILYWVSSETSRCARQDFFIFFLFFDLTCHPRAPPKGPSGLSKPTFLGPKQTLPCGVSSEASQCAYYKFLFFKKISTSLVTQGPF